MQLYIGHAKILLHSMDNFEYVESNSYRGLLIFRGFRVHRPYCVKHNQHAKHANARGMEASPPAKLLKIDALRLNLGPFQDQASYIIMSMDLFISSHSYLSDGRLAS